MLFSFFHRFAFVAIVAAVLGVLPARAAGVDFPVTDPAQWKVSGAESQKLTVEVQGGALLLHWPGGAGQAIVQSAQATPVAPLLNEGFVRYVAQLNILEYKYGAELAVQIQPFGKDGQAAPPYFMRAPQYGGTGQVTGPEGSMDRLFAPPGQWARVDFNYKPTANIATIAPRFVLQGNAMTVAIQSVRLETGLTWERGRPKAQPEAREFDEARVQQILAQREQAKPRLEKRPGRVALVVNNRDVLPACYTRGSYYPQYTRYGAFAKAGYNLVRVPAFFNPLSETHKAGVGGMWTGKNSFDFSSLERELKVVASINPDALVIVSANIMPYHGWAEENPDSIVTNEKGEKLVVYGGEELHYGGTPDHSSNREADYAPSFYGGQFPPDAANAVRHLAEFLQTSPVGKIVIGVEFVGGTDGQLYPWDRDRARGADYSPVALQSWRNFLRRRYENDVSKLRAAWKDDGVTFETAPVATLAERGYASGTIAPRGVDYSDFLSDAMADFTLGLGKALKEGSDNRLLAGAYYSDSGWQGVISHGASYRVMQSPYLDMVRSVMIYQTSGSWWQHNKLTWAELDMRPPMPNPMQYYTAGLDYSPKYFQTFVWRNTVAALTDLRGGFYPYDMAESWYQTPEIINVFGEARAGIEASLDDTVNVAPTVGVFSDERVPFRLADTLGYRTTRTSLIGLYRALDRSGVPYARFLLDDALDPNFELPKICILRLPMAITPAQAGVLREKARRSGSVLIWGYAPGYVAAGAPDSKSVTGFAAKSTGAVKGRSIVMQDAGALTKGLAGDFLGAPPPPISLNESTRWNGWPWVIQPEAGDVVLGQYEGTKQAGAVLRVRDGLTQILIGVPGAMSPQFIRNMAQSVGVTPFSDANDEMRFGSGLLSFYAERGGARTITLSPGMKVASSPTGTKFQPTKDGFTFEIGYSDIAVFKIVKP